MKNKQRPARLKRSEQPCGRSICTPPSVFYLSFLRMWKSRREFRHRRC